MTIAEEVALLLLNIKAVTVSTSPPYIWSSGIKAPIYCDNRLVISFPKERKMIIDNFKQIIKEKNLEFDIIGGTAMAGVPWAAFLAYELHKPMIYIRPEPKAHGKGKQVEGIMESGMRVLIVEDLISTGGSSLKSAAACVTEYNARITDVLAIFNYQMNAATESFAQAHINLHSLSNFSTLIDVAEREKYLTLTEKTQALSWSADPKNWWETIFK
jgi:orotidine-5'-phosphate decarboxylase